MYPVSAVFKEKIKNLDRVFQANIQIQHSQGVLNLGDADIAQGSLSYTEASQAGEDFTVGGVVASDLRVEILNKPEYATIEFIGATLTASIGLEVAENTFEYVPLGIFNIDEANRQRNVIGIKAIDNMIKFDKPYSRSNLIYPASLLQIFNDACTVCGVTPGTTAFLNSDYVVQERPSGDLTFRDILSYVAELSGAFARCNRTGAVELVWYTPTGITLTGANRFDFKPNDELVSIKGVMCIVGDTTYLAGSDEYAVDLTHNPLLQSEYQNIVASIFAAIKDISFYPFESSWQGNPAIQAGDTLTQVDRDGKQWPTIVTSNTYKYRGASTLAAKGLPVSAKGFKGSTNKKITNIVRVVQKETETRLDTLEQAQLNATELIANMLGGYAIQGPDAFYVADNPDLQQAVKVWKFGLGGFGYSNNGVGGPYETAVTADGSIVAMLVAAGIVTADMIQTGLLQSQDGSTWINLDDGWFNFKNALKWDGQAIQVLDNLEKERVRIGNYAEGKYGLLIKDSSGDKTLLDEDGLLQTWQEGRADNVESGKPLVLSVFLPTETRQINRAILRFRRQAFRAYEKAAASGGATTSGASSTSTTASGGATTSGASSTSTTASGGGTTSGSSSISTTASGGDHRHQMFYNYWSASQPTSWRELKACSSIGGGSVSIVVGTGSYNDLYTYSADGDHKHDMQHTHTVSAHEHGMQHTHTIQTHTHGMEHTHTIPNHTHPLDFGIYTGTSASNVTVKINGADRTSALGGGTGFNVDKDDLNITPYMQVGQWNVIELGSTTLGRIDATVFIQALMGVS